ncbi:cytochrome P450 CYP82D47-like [Aristolochia californica]|uniref:cytochrome P450 CYP82D47-like n=1 Tax=Aristolochia californica TaxID=171875 RepID=UPI0035DD9204
MEAVLLFVGLLAVVFAYFLCVARRTSKTTGIGQPPEPAGRWPVVGHLPLLQGNEQVALTFAALADKFGPVFTIWMGVHRTLVVSSWELAKECFGTNDKILATRPRGAAGKYLAHNYTMFGLAPYGPFWRDSRKLATIELLSSHRLESLKHLRATEVGLSIKHLHELWEENNKLPVKMDMTEWFLDLTFNTIVMMIAGKRYLGSNITADLEEARRAKQAIIEFAVLMGTFVASDAVPFLEWLDLKGHISAMKRASKELDCIMSLWVNEHRQRRNLDKSKKDGDFMDVMLFKTDRTETHAGDVSDKYIKATSLTLIIPAIDTSFVTLTWTLSLLLNHRHELKKAQDEIDTIIGKDRTVDESDIENLPYLRAIVKESLRLYPAAPLAVPHEAMEDCNIGGFHVPAGTRIITNLYKLHRDPRVWPEPEEFRPSRFLSSHRDMDVRGKHFEFIPFGSGRRMCPGITSALQVVHFSLARLLHGFHIDTQDGERVGMRGGPGATMPRMDPLDVILTPRLASNLYG